MKILSVLLLFSTTYPCCCPKKTPIKPKPKLERSVQLSPAQWEAIRRELVRSNIVANPAID